MVEHPKELGEWRETAASSARSSENNGVGTPAGTARSRAADGADLDRHYEILERIARGAPLEETLRSICLHLESELPGTWCSVQLVGSDGALHHAAAPSLPPLFVEALEGLEPGEGVGACGTAAHRVETVVVEDVRTDALAAPFLALAERHQIRSVWSQPLVDANGAVTGTFAVYRRVPHRPDEEEVRRVVAFGHLAGLAIERHRNEQALAAAAQIDPLTGLPNRAQFLDRLRQAMQDNADVAVMFLDLDRFKWINDGQGHPVGDGVLIEVAHRIRQVLRGNDVVARFGGDEFTVLMRGASRDHVELVAERISAAFGEPFILAGGAEYYLTASIGIAFGEPGLEAFDLVRNADAAMYAAKEGGRDRYALFDETLRDRALTRITLESDLRRAVERDELALCFQPVVDLHTNQWTSVEALVRWVHPERGTVLPDDFIPLAEETGLIVPLGIHVLELVIDQAAAWAAEGIDLPIAANVSIVQLADSAVAEALAGLLRRHGVDPARIIIEVTETSVMERLDSVQNVLADLAGIGVLVAVDDFGTGYSSIARMSELPVQGVKIDRVFTKHLGSDPHARRVLGAITDLAHALDLYVVAEGVETEEALRYVRSEGCDQAQGFLLAHPQSAEVITELLRRPPQLNEAACG